MLKSDAASSDEGFLNINAINTASVDGARRMYAIQELALSTPTGMMDERTYNSIESILQTTDFSDAYANELTPEIIEILAAREREKIGRDVGDWIEDGGRDIIAGVTTIGIAVSINAINGAYTHVNQSNKSNGISPSSMARSFQGSGKYIGVDDYSDVIVEKGTVLYRGEPNGTGYFTTWDAIEQSGYDATKVFEGLQVEKHPIYGYRPEMKGYLFNEDIASAYGITKANPQFGQGGLPQYFVPNVEEYIENGILQPVKKIALN